MRINFDIFMLNNLQNASFAVKNGAKIYTEMTNSRPSKMNTIARSPSRFSNRLYATKQ